MFLIVHGRLGLVKTFTFLQYFSSSETNLFSESSFIKEKIKLIPSGDISLDVKSKAKILSPHTKDEAYFAVALAFNAMIWSEEKSFIKQSGVKICNTSELVRLILSF